MRWLLTAAGAVGTGIIALFCRPLRNRVEPRLARVLGDHGITIRAYSTPLELADLDLGKLLENGPEQLAHSMFYLDRPKPPAGPVDGVPTWQWAQEHGGRDVGYSHVLLIIQSTQDRTVLLRPPKVIRSRSEVSSGIVCCPEGLGGAGLAVRRFSLDLDDHYPMAQYVNERGCKPASDVPMFRMGKASTEAILVVAKADRGYHKWTLEVPLIVDGQEIVLAVNDHRRPFVTVGREGVPLFAWVDDQRQWVGPQ